MSKAARPQKTAYPPSALGARQRVQDAITEILKVCDTRDFLRGRSRSRATDASPIP